MFTKVKNQEKGFTIIEVLIVLAIAGLIMLVVFLAVPALQRNSRNTQRKADVQALLGAISEYQSNNNGSMPTTSAQVTGNARLGFYATTEVTFASGATLTTASPQNVVDIRTGVKCNGGGVTTTGASSRNVAAVYYVETSTGTQAVCQES